MILLSWTSHARDSVNFEKTRRAAIAHLFVHVYGAEWNRDLWKGFGGIQAKNCNVLGIPNQDITKVFDAVLQCNDDGVPYEGQSVQY